jgi:hypothetical protein
MTFAEVQTLAQLQTEKYSYVGNRHFIDGVSTTSLTFDTLPQSDKSHLKASEEPIDVCAKV